MSAQLTEAPRPDPDPIVVQMEVLRTPIIRPDQPAEATIDLGQTGGYDPDPSHPYAGVLSIRVPTEAALLIEKGDGFAVIVARSDGEEAPSYLDPRFADVAFRNGAAVSQGATAVYDHAPGDVCYWFPAVAGPGPDGEPGHWNRLAPDSGPNLRIGYAGMCFRPHQNRYVRRLVADGLLNERARQIKTDG